MTSGDDIILLGLLAKEVPKEMIWAYETVRLSGIWNMNWIRFPGVETDSHNCMKAIEQAYYRFIDYSKVNLEETYYPKLTRDHLRLVAEVYMKDMLKMYPPMPEGVVELKKEIRMTYSM